MASQQVLTAANLDTGNSINSLAVLIKRLSAMPGKRTIVLISPGFLVTRDLAQAQTSLIDSAIRANVTLSSVALTHAASIQTPPAPPGRTGTRFMNSPTGPAGNTLATTTALPMDWLNLKPPPTYTYILAFSPQNLKYDGSYHGLKISLVNAKKVDIQALAGAIGLLPAPPMPPNRRKKRSAKPSSRSMRSATFLSTSPQSSSNSAKPPELTVASHLDLHGLHFRATGDRNQDTLTVVTGMFDQDGHYVKGTQRIIDSRLREHPRQTAGLRHERERNV